MISYPRHCLHAGVLFLQKPASLPLRSWTKEVVLLSSAAVSTVRCCPMLLLQDNMNQSCVPDIHDLCLQCAAGHIVAALQAPLLLTLPQAVSGLSRWYMICRSWTSPVAAMPSVAAFWLRGRQVVLCLKQLSGEQQQQVSWLNAQQCHPTRRWSCMLLLRRGRPPLAVARS